MLQYNPLNDNFTTFENVDKPKIVENPIIGSFELPRGWDISPTGGFIVKRNNINKKEESPGIKFNNEPSIEESPIEEPPIEEPEEKNSSFKINKNWKNNAIYIMNRLINDKKMKPHEAAGVVGNLISESQLNPASYNPNDVGLPAGGIAGFRGSLFSKLKSYSKNNSKSWKDMDTQIDFLYNILNENNPQMNDVRDRLLRSKNPYEASEAWAYYEKYAGYDGTTKTARKAGWSQDRINEEHKKRGNLANEVYKLWESQS